MSQASTDAGLLTPANCRAAFVDHQTGMLAQLSRDNRSRVTQGVLRLAKTCRIFSVPATSSAIVAPGFDGCLYPQLLRELAPARPLRRSSINAWDTDEFSAQFRQTSRRNVVIAGLWIESNVLFPVLQMLDEGLYLYVVEDASGSIDAWTHAAAIRRMEQAGAVSITSAQLLQEFQRDWAREETAAEVRALLQDRVDRPARKGAGRTPRR